MSCGVVRCHAVSRGAVSWGVVGCRAVRCGVVSFYNPSTDNTLYYISKAEEDPSVPGGVPGEDGERQVRELRAHLVRHILGGLQRAADSLSCLRLSDILYYYII